MTNVTVLVNIAQVTQKIICFCYQKLCVQDQNIHEKIEIWKKTLPSITRQSDALCFPLTLVQNVRHYFIDIVAQKDTMYRELTYHKHLPVKPFQNQIKCLLDTLILKLFFQIMRINDFRGDLSDISAKKYHWHLHVVQCIAVICLHAITQIRARRLILDKDY